MTMRAASILSGAMLLGLTACSDVGVGFKNHPIDCALGIVWTDCLPGTAGYEGTPKQLAYHGVYKREAEERDRRMNAAAAEARNCIKRRKAGELASDVAAAMCVNDAMERGFAETRYPHMDLIYAVSATHLRTAEQVDKSEITEAEGAVRIAEKISEITSEERRRRAEEIRANVAATRSHGRARYASPQARATEAQEHAARQLENLSIFQTAPAPFPRTTTCGTSYGTTGCVTP
jgi:hypothetical protein